MIHLNVTSNYVEKTIWEEERTQIKYTIKKSEFYVKNPNRKKSRSRTQIYYIIRETTGEKKSTDVLYLQ